MSKWIGKRNKTSRCSISSQKNDQYLAQENGINHWVAKDDSRATIFTSSKDGTFSVHGLSFGSYELVEIKPPKGYILSQSTILFEVEKGSYDPLHPIPLEIINEPKANPTNNGKRQFRCRQMVHQMKKWRKLSKNKRRDAWRFLNFRVIASPFNRDSLVL